MKFLFQDKIIGKINKIPTVFWFLLLATSEFFAAAYVLLNNAKINVADMAAQYENLFAEAELSINQPVMIAVTCVLSALVSAVICEVLIRVAFAVVRRYAMDVQKFDFCFRVRLVIILSNVVLGLIGIVHFFFSNLTGILTSVFEVTVPALLLGWFYEDYRVRFVPRQNQARVFSLVAKLYLGIYFALRAIDLILALGVYKRDLSALDTAAVIVAPSIVLVLGLIALLDYFRLKKISSVPEESTIDNNDEKPKDDTIFRDFGF